MTIDGIEQVNVSKRGAEPKYEYAMRLLEFDVLWVLNITNMLNCQKILGSENSDDWLGESIELYVDPNVSFKGKTVGGIRVREAPSMSDSEL